MVGLGAVAGISFAVSLFIGGLSYPGEELLTAEAQIGILVGSLVLALIGVALLLTFSSRSSESEDTEPVPETA